MQDWIFALEAQREKIVLRAMNSHDNRNAQDVEDVLGWVKM